jgi:hypothetical protein
MKAYDGPFESLDLSSQYYFIIKDVPRYQVRLRTIVFRGEYQERLTPALNDLEKIEKSCNVLRSNENFKKFLKVILDIGNQMNSGTARGQALGFKMSSLMALMSLKSNKENVTLFQYVMQVSINNDLFFLFFFVVVLK